MKYFYRLGVAPNLVAQGLVVLAISGCAETPTTTANPSEDKESSTSGGDPSSRHDEGTQPSTQPTGNGEHSTSSEARPPIVDASVDVTGYDASVMEQSSSSEDTTATPGRPVLVPRPAPDTASETTSPLLDSHQGDAQEDAGSDHSEDTSCIGLSSCGSQTTSDETLGCPLGFEFNGTVCVDVDECAEENGGCGPLSTCVPSGVPGEAPTCGPERASITRLEPPRNPSNSAVLIVGENISKNTVTGIKVGGKLIPEEDVQWPHFEDDYYKNTVAIVVRDLLPGEVVDVEVLTAGGPSAPRSFEVLEKFPLGPWPPERYVFSPHSVDIPVLTALPRATASDEAPYYYYSIRVHTDVCGPMPISGDERFRTCGPAPCCLDPGSDYYRACTSEELQRGEGVSLQISGYLEPRTGEVYIEIDRGDPPAVYTGHLTKENVAAGRGGGLSLKDAEGRQLYLRVHSGNPDIRLGSKTALGAGTYLVSHVAGCLFDEETSQWNVHGGTDLEGRWSLSDADGKTLVTLPGTSAGEGRGFGSYDECVWANLALPPVEFNHLGGDVFVRSAEHEVDAGGTQGMGNTETPLWSFRSIPNDCE